MADERKLEVKSFPLAQYWGRGIFVALILVVMFFLTYKITGSLVLPFIAIFVISIPQANFILPATYVFYEDTFTKEQLFQIKRYEYQNFKLLSERADGILLFKDNGRAFDFIYIFEKAKRKAAMIVLEKKICPAEYDQAKK